MNEDHVLSLLNDFTRTRIMILGDIMLDRFIYGHIERISPEAPVPVFSVEREMIMPGGAANVARNVASLGGTAVLIGVVGADKNGASLKALLDSNDRIEADVISAPGRPTTVKDRLVAGSQQVIRMDKEVRTDICVEVDDLLARVERHLTDVDIVVLSDYAKGVLCPQVVKQVIASCARVGKPVVVDPKCADPGRYDGATLITPNLAEAAQMAKLSGSDDSAVEAMADAIFAAAPHTESLIITRSANGMSVANRGLPVTHLPVVAREVADVSGAGDTVVAVLSLALASGHNLVGAAELANVAAGIAVGKLGTTVVLPAEFARALQCGKISEIVAKIADATQVLEMASLWRQRGFKVGFTNGCFDLVHPGHIHLLQTARSHCDRLVVGLNSDASVRRLKGPARPIQDELARAVVLGAMAVVDLVVLFDEDTPIELIHQIRPDVLVKGADYSIDQVVGADFVKSYNGRVVLAEITPGQSTTGILRRMEVAKSRSTSPS